MTFPRARLAVSACLFIGWLIFLFVVWLRSYTVILSSPQFMIAQIYAVVDVRDDQGKADPDVTVEEVLWASDPADGQLAKAQHLVEISRCIRQNGYHGAGTYLVPLIKTPIGIMIAPLPRSEPRQIRIYPWDASTRTQVNGIIAAKK
jgi:hypothetical protein